MHHTCYTGECEHHLKDGRVGRFKPDGPLHIVHVRAERKHGRGAHEASPEDELPFNSEREPWDTTGLSARLFVGLKVGKTLKWSIDDVMKATYGYLKVPDNLPGNSTFIAQKGWYRGVMEDSVQIVLFDENGLSFDMWTTKMLTLGAFLRQRFEQESVIVEIQKGGALQSLQAVKERSVVPT